MALAPDGSTHQVLALSLSETFPTKDKALVKENEEPVLQQLENQKVPPLC